MIENDETSPLFVYFLTPLKNFLNAFLDGVTNVLLRMTWIGVVTAAAVIGGLLAGWKMALLAGLGVPVAGRARVVGVEHGDPGADPGGRHGGAR